MCYGLLSCITVICPTTLLQSNPSFLSVKRVLMKYLFQMMTGDQRPFEKMFCIFLPQLVSNQPASTVLLKLYAEEGHQMWLIQQVYICPIPSGAAVHYISSPAFSTWKIQKLAICRSRLWHGRLVNQRWCLQPDCRDPTALVASSTQRSCLDLCCRMGPCPEPCAGLASDRQGPSQQDSFWLSSHCNHPNWAGVKPEESGGGGKGGKQRDCLRKNWEVGGPCAQTCCGMACAAQYLSAWISLDCGRHPLNPGLLWAATTFPEHTKSPPLPVCKGLGNRRPKCLKEPVAAAWRLPLVFLLPAVMNSIFLCRRKSLCGGSHTLWSKTSP